MRPSLVLELGLAEAGLREAMTVLRSGGREGGVEDREEGGRGAEGRLYF